MIWLVVVLLVLTWRWQSCKRVTRWEWCSIFDKVQPIKMIYALLRKQYLHPLLKSTSPAFLWSSNTARSAPAQEPPAADLIWNPLPVRPVNNSKSGVKPVNQSQQQHQQQQQCTSSRAPCCWFNLKSTPSLTRCSVCTLHSYKYTTAAHWTTIIIRLSKMRALSNDSA